MNFIKNFGKFINEQYKSGIYAFWNDETNQIEIEEVLTSGHVSTHLLDATADELIEWYLKNFGRGDYYEGFNSVDGHVEKSREMTDDEILDLVKSDYLKMYSLQRREEWIEVEE